MPTSRQKSVLVLTLTVLVGAAALLFVARNDALDSFEGTTPDTANQVENLRAFAKLHGYVRYFHPSDAAARINWDKFAVHGVRQARDAANRVEHRGERCHNSHGPDRQLPSDLD